MATRMRLRDRDVLRAYLRLLGLSGRELAARAGVGHATVNHLLTGRRATCSPATARALAGALCCPADVFFEPQHRDHSPTGNFSLSDSRHNRANRPDRYAGGVGGQRRW